VNDLEALARDVEGHIDHLKADVQKIETGGFRKGQRTSEGMWEDRTEQVIHDQRNLIRTLEVVLDLILRVRGHGLS
jgi:hypothetical protein